MPLQHHPVPISFTAYLSQISCFVPEHLSSPRRITAPAFPSSVQAETASHLCSFPLSSQHDCCSFRRSCCSSVLRRLPPHGDTRRFPDTSSSPVSPHRTSHQAPHGAGTAFRFRSRFPFHPDGEHTTSSVWTGCSCGLLACPFRVIFSCPEWNIYAAVPTPASSRISRNIRIPFRIFFFFLFL